MAVPAEGQPPPPATAAAHASTASPAAGLASAGRLSLAQALEAAWQRAPAASEAAGLRAWAQAERSAAQRLLPAPPALELQARSDRWHRRSGARETELGVSGALWWPGQRAALSAAADADADHARAAEAAARWRLAGELREAAARLGALQAEKAQAQALAAGLQALADDVDRRVQAGDLAPADALAARAEWLAAQAEEGRLRQLLQSALRQWTLLTGLDTPPDPEPAEAPAEPQAALADHPEQRLAEQAVAQAHQRLAALEAARRPSPELSLGLRQDVGGSGQAAQGSLAIGLRLPWGSDDRSLPERARAAAALDAAMLQAERLRERLRSSADDAQAAVQAAQQQLLAAQARAGLLRERASLIERAQRAGQMALPDLLRARAALADAEAAAQRHEQALQQARIARKHSLGVLP